MLMKLSATSVFIGNNVANILKKIKSVLFYRVNVGRLILIYGWMALFYRYIGVFFMIDSVFNRYCKIDVEIFLELKTCKKDILSLIL